jgi:tetratricopeptide (TPR) repeat protein
VNANYFINTGNYNRAIPLLETAIKNEPNKAQRARLTFLLGQLYTIDGKPQQAYDAYHRVINMNPTYRTQFNARIKMSEVYAGSDISKEIKSLERMSRKEVTIDSNGEQRIVVANTSKTPIRLRGVATLEGITFRCYHEVIEADTEANIMIGYRGSVRDITTMIVVEGVECRPSERVIKVTIKR